jgi:quinol monooxygenase YgiN
MAETKILVTGYFDIDPTKADEFAVAAKEVMAATEAEDGNEGYAFTADLAEPGRYHVAEQWANDEALQAHMTSAHMATFMGKMGGFGLTGGSLTRWDGATPGKLM